MIWPTLLRVRKNSSSSSIAISGAGMLPFITPTSIIGRGSTCPSMMLPASMSGTCPTAPFVKGEPRTGGRRVAGLERHRTRIHGIEGGREPGTRQAERDVTEPRQRAEGEHVRLRAVAHRGETVTTRDVLALDGRSEERRVGKECRYR